MLRDCGRHTARPCQGQRVAMSRHHRYAGQAKGAAWERQRQLTLAVDSYRCARCGKAGRLEAHHKRPVSDGGTNELNNLETLCRGCHITEHKPVMGEQEQAWQALLGESQG